MTIIESMNKAYQGYVSDNNKKPQEICINKAAYNELKEEFQTMCNASVSEESNFRGVPLKVDEHQKEYISVY